METMKQLHEKTKALNKAIKKFGKTKCKFRSRSKNHFCTHPNSGYDCELENCPRALYGDEGEEATDFEESCEE